MSREPTHRIEEDWAVLVRFENNPRRKQLTRYITTFRKFGKNYRRHEEVHRVQLYDPAEIATMLREIGFRVRRSRKYGDFPLLESTTAFIARKPLK